MKNKMSIGIFDSGIGGLTILKEIRKILPRENIIYYGDFKNNPYGIKTTSEIQKLSEFIVKFMIQNHCKVIIIACSLMTAASLEYLKNKYSIPIIGVVEGGVKAALLESKKKKIAYIANPFTVKTKIYENTYKKYSEDGSLYGIPCKKLCALIESGWENHPHRLEVLKKCLEKIPKDTDTLILGGTHYPLIKKDIRKFFSEKIVDSSRESVFELLNILISTDLFNKENKKGSVDFCINGDTTLLLNRLLEIFIEKFKNIFSVDF
ncbi:MAG: glutamate racemase [Fusobacteriia bacterium 4572_74]|nr:MAG: glutamate racemase [Fusobacteriia bacterium 4572_74]